MGYIVFKSAGIVHGMLLKGYEVDLYNRWCMERETSVYGKRFRNYKPNTLAPRYIIVNFIDMTPLCIP